MLKELGLSLILTSLANLCFAFEREIAITIDDLPFVGVADSCAEVLQIEGTCFQKMLQPLINNNVPVTGFVIAGAVVKGQWQWLEQFQQAGFILGNHTFSHANLNAMSTQKFIREVDRADKILAPLMSAPKYFRYPFLAEGSGIKKQQVLNFLKANNYIIAPVTIDSKDFVFNARLYAVSKRNRLQKLQQIKPKYLAYIWDQTLKAERWARQSNRHASKQILLIHANLLNSFCMGDIIELFKKNGYRFISLAEALSEPVLNPVTDISFTDEELEFNWLRE